MTALLTVNGVTITIERALRDALLERSSSGVLGSLIDRELLRQYAAARGIGVSDEELQLAANEMRYERGLEDGERMMEWARAHGQTLESLQDSIESVLLRNKVMSSISDDSIEQFYRDHGRDLVYVVLFSIRVDRVSDAEALRRRIEAGEQFATIAASQSLDETTRGSGGLVGRLRRSELSPEIAEEVFAVEVGAIVGPLRTAKGINLFLVSDRRMPALEEESADIRLLLFEELIAGLRAEAEIRYPLIEG